MHAWHPCIKGFVLAAMGGLLVLAGAPLAAQETSWIGELVLHTKPPADIRFVDGVGDREVAYAFSGTWPFTVRDEKDGRLRIHDRRREGWVQKSDFVLAREAIPYFTGRIEADPRDVFALKMRGAAWLQKQQPDKAISDFNASLALKANDPEAYNNRGIGWKDKQQYEKAIADYSEAIRINARVPVYHFNRGTARRLIKEYDPAIQDFSATIRLEPRYAAAFCERGICYVLKKEYDQALEDYDASIRLDPRYAPAYRERGLVWRYKKDYAKALADYDQAVKVAPKYSAVMADQAWLLATCADATYRDGNRALALAKQACALSNYKVPSQLSALAAAHAETGDYKEAARWMKKALENPQYTKMAGAKGQRRLKLYEAGMPYHESTPP